MTRIQGPLYGGGMVPSPLHIGPLVPGNRMVTYLRPVSIARQELIDVAAPLTTGIVTAKTGAQLPGAAGSVTFTPDGSIGVAAVVHPRNVVITVTHATAVVAMSGVISGFDEYGNLTTEAWSVTAGGTTKTFTGLVTFARWTSITAVVASNAQANTMIVGTGVTLGIQFATPIAGLVREALNGTVITTGVIVPASALANNDRRGTYTPATAPNGTNDYSIYYLVPDPSIGLAL